MKRFVGIVLAVVLAVAAATPAFAQSRGTVDKSRSEALTKYLHKNRLPMVGAQVSTTSNGARQIVLYGFTATDFGKTDAEKKSKHYLHDSTAVVMNHIRVDPAIRRLKRRPEPGEQQGPAGAQEAQDPKLPPTADWERTLDDTLQSGGASPSNDPALKMPSSSSP